MSSPRDPDLAAVLDAHKAIAAALPSITVQPLFERCHTALEAPGTPNFRYQPQKIPVCNHITEGSRVTTAASPGLARLAAAFGRLAPKLAWQRREGLQAKGAFLRRRASSTGLARSLGLRLQRMALELCSRLLLTIRHLAG